MTPETEASQAREVERTFVLTEAKRLLANTKRSQAGHDCDGKVIVRMNRGLEALDLLPRLVKLCERLLADANEEHQRAEALSRPAATTDEPRPTCQQYSHSLREDRLGEAIRHFESMYSHRGDGIPTQFSSDEKAREMAQVLVAAALSAPPAGMVPDELRALSEKATAGEWEVYGEPDVGIPPSAFIITGRAGPFPSREPLEPLQGYNLELAVAAVNYVRAMIEARPLSGEVLK